MIKNIIKYVGIALVIVGVLLVMKNLFSKDTDWSTNDEIVNKYYSAKIKLLDEETYDYLTGAKLVLKDENDKVVSEWTTEEKVYIINELRNGKYTLIEEVAPENYHLNVEGITFEIDGKDKNVIMYNTKMNDEEIKDANTTESEVKVDNTSSNKSILTIIIAMLISSMGIKLIYKVKKNY